MSVLCNEERTPQLSPMLEKVVEKVNMQTWSFARGVDKYSCVQQSRGIGEAKKSSGEANKVGVLSGLSTL